MTRIRQRSDKKGIQIDYEFADKRIRKTIRPFPLADLVTVPCVYFLMDGEECVYVGKTVSLPSRIYDHIKSEKKFESVYYLEISETEYEYIEGVIISSLKPKYNKQIENNR